MEKLIKERIEENEKLFSVEELKIIKNNVNIVKKIYMLGLLDGGQKSGHI